MHTHRPTLAKAEQWFGGDEEDHPAQNSTFVKCAKTALPNTPAPEGNLSSGTSTERQAGPGLSCQPSLPTAPLVRKQSFYLFLPV